MQLLTGAVPDCVRIRPPLYHPDFPYILFWSQKAGCTTVVKWFFAQVGLLEEALAFSPWVHRYEGEVYKRRPGYRKELHAALRSNRYTAVKVVRDPWRRAPRAFLILGERGAIVPRHHWVQRHWQDVDAWLAARGKDPAHGISFLDHLALIRESEAERPHTINPHLSAQHVAGEEAFLDERVPIEAFEEWATRAAGRDGVRPVDFASIADSRHHHTVDEAVTARLGERPEETPITRGAFKDGRFPAAGAFINERSRPAIAATYSADLEAYGALYRG